jgi:Helix-turn-helix domain
MSSSDGAPTIGAPFNPWRRFLVACVPDPLLRSNLVSNGAKLCWAQLARHAGKDGNCFPRQSTLAAEIGVTDRMIRYYLRELENSGLLRTIHVGLNEPNRYEFLWHAVFETASSLISQDRKSFSGQDRKYSSVQERKSSSGPLKEEESPLRESIEETQSIDRARRRSRHPHRHAALREWPTVDIDAIRGALVSFRYKDGSQVQATDELVARLLETAKFYMRSAFELAALLYRKGTDIQLKPRWWPEKPDWFVHVVDRAYADDWITERIQPVQTTTRAASVYPEDPATQAEFDSLLNQLAHAKQFPGHKDRNQE